jgi:phosphotransferase system  glucose/maltose/N-acetylglucosamine-specific IIC component
MSFTGGIGMIELFNDRLLIDPILRMGDLFFYGIALLLGYLAARGVPNVLTERVGRPGPDSLTGLLTGVIAGVVTAAYVWFVHSVDLGQFFPKMDDAMVNSLTFDLGVPFGLVALVVVSAVVGGAGGLISSLSAQVRKRVAWTTGWVLGVALLEVVVADIIEVRPVIRSIYSR